MKQLLPKAKTSIRLDEIIKDVKYFKVMKNKK